MSIDYKQKYYKYLSIYKNLKGGETSDTLLKGFQKAKLNSLDALQKGNLPLAYHKITPIKRILSALLRVKKNNKDRTFNSHLSWLTWLEEYIDNVHNNRKWLKEHYPNIYDRIDNFYSTGYHTLDLNSDYKDNLTNKEYAEITKDFIGRFMDKNRLGSELSDVISFVYGPIAFDYNSNIYKETPIYSDHFDIPSDKYNFEFPLDKLMNSTPKDIGPQFESINYKIDNHKQDLFQDSLDNIPTPLD